MKTYRTHHTTRLALVLLGTFALGAGGVTAAFAEDDVPLRQIENKRLKQHEARMEWNSLTPEQQEAATAKAKDVYDTASPRAKAAWRNLTPEQQTAAKTEAKTRTRAWGQEVKDDQEALSQEEKYQMRDENQALRRERRSQNTE